MMAEICKECIGNINSSCEKARKGKIISCALFVPKKQIKEHRIFVKKEVIKYVE